MGNDIELLKLNLALNLESLSIHLKVSPFNGVNVIPHSRLNVTIRKKKWVKHNVNGVRGVVLVGVSLNFLEG